MTNSSICRKIKMRIAVPMNSTSTPWTAAMASALLIASGLSSITTVRISALIVAWASAVEGG
jgi:uncharacterized membrane protein